MPDLLDELKPILPPVGMKMIMQVVDLLAVTVVDHDPEPVDQVKLVGDDLDRSVEHGQNLRIGQVEVFRHGLRDQQQMHRCLGADVFNDDHLVGLIEYLRRKFAIDYACEDRWHGGVIAAAALQSKG